MKRIHIKNRKFEMYITIAVLILIVVILIISCLHWIFKLLYISPYEAEDFLKNKKDLDALSNMLWDRFMPELKEKDSDISSIRVMPYYDELMIQYNYESDSKEPLVVYEAMNESTVGYFETVKKVLPQDSEQLGAFTDILISKDQIAYVRCGGHYALVYSKCHKPDYIYESSSNCFIDKITFNWYQVADKNKYPARVAWQ